MQTTERDAMVSELFKNSGKSGMTLVIANKNYSSWSMRPWVLMKAFNIPFQEIRILLDEPNTATEIAKYSDAG
ncbi:MAG: glutathione S-transferase, partial [Glaciimonas sp.]|nr:glutathione S-transferase [Glaciimonas sp.]